MTSPFFGGPERLMLGLTQNCRRQSGRLSSSSPTAGKAGASAGGSRDNGLETITFMHDTPHLASMVREIRAGCGSGMPTSSAATATRPTLSACSRHGVRSVPVIAMSHGWTAETWKVRVYEALDRVCLRRMDRVVCVSEGQAGKVRRAACGPTG